MHSVRAVSGKRKKMGWGGEERRRVRPCEENRAQKVPEINSRVTTCCKKDALMQKF